MSEIQVGQQLWFVSKIRTSFNCFVTVMKIGRKWIDLSNHTKADMTTMKVYGSRDLHHVIGHCFLDRDDWADNVYRQSLWRELSKGVRYNSLVPAGMSEQRIRAAAALLDIDLSAAVPTIEPGVTDAG